MDDLDGLTGRNEDNVLLARRWGGKGNDPMVSFPSSALLFSTGVSSMSESFSSNFFNIASGASNLSSSSAIPKDSARRLEGRLRTIGAAGRPDTCLASGELSGSSSMYFFAGALRSATVKGGVRDSSESEAGTSR